MSAVANALGSGLAGACALTAAHQLLQKVTADAPRMDVLGERAIARGFEAVGATPPGEPTLYGLTLAGDIVSNSLFYSLVGLGSKKGAVARGAVLGLLAGVGGVVLPGPMGLGRGPSARTPATQALTVALYTLGGLTAGAVYAMLGNGESSN